MKLSFVLNAAGFTAQELETTCEVNFENGAVTESHLVLRAVVPGIDEAKFAACVADAEKNCPISKLLNTKISVSYTLNA